MDFTYHDKDDLQLWQLISTQSDAGAFAEVHRRFSTSLFALAYRKTGDETVAEDLVQDLFVALWTGRDTIHPEKALNSYLFSALKNRIISYYRKQLHRDSVSLSVLQPETLVSYSANAVEEYINFRQANESYQVQLQNLPEKTREVFELSRSGLTNKEIGGLLGLAEKTIEFHISKSLKLLRMGMGYSSYLLLVWFSK
ncbi:hypothetical protein DYBT9275_05501 [Dyadobacter sp. CECT 9275]|uniref:HTH luxR-type domain-containing protein n=1 Tax=Dyadobacter helix TaxID=2822344 RepID=A0A916JHZ0_9BACT|nr:sigma-70 family RNA polymerase sigma factor [Dyadobacter sp. CECT 9275]CAG5016222.1 hypothetical protein DYBT9275_05501 [Dyadobacter sp. CECT 9275]